MRRSMIGAAMCVLAVAALMTSSGAAAPKVTYSIPKELKAEIIKTLNSPNLRVRVVNEAERRSITHSWDYQSPDRAESIPRRIEVSGKSYGAQIEIGETIVDQYSFSKLDPGLKTNPNPKIQFIGLKLPPVIGRWSSEQQQLLAPLIDALSGNRYVKSKHTYIFSTKNRIEGKVTINDRRVVSAEISFLQASCSGRVIPYQESEYFYGIEHFAEVSGPPGSAVQYSTTGKTTPVTTNVCE